MLVLLLVSSQSGRPPEPLFSRSLRLGVRDSSGHFTSQDKSLHVSPAAATSLLCLSLPFPQKGHAPAARLGQLGQVGFGCAPAGSAAILLTLVK